MPQKIEISHRTIIFTILFLIFLWFLWQIRQIIIGLFVSLILMAAINPLIDKMQKMRIPRALAILLVYLVIFVSMGLIIAGIVPPLIEQTSILIDKIPEFIKKLNIPSIDPRLIESQISHLGSIPSGLVKASVVIFSNLLWIFVLMVITFYLLLERKNLNRYLHVLFGSDGEKKATRFINQLEKKLGGWVRAELTLMLIVGIMSYLGLRLLGIDFALPLALLAGIFEVFPNVGPTLASIPAFIAGLAISPLTALAVVALYFLIQQIENSLIVPQVMAKEAGVNPLITIISLAIGFKVGGVIGAILSIPTVLMFQIIVSEVLFSQKIK